MTKLYASLLALALLLAATPVSADCAGHSTTSAQSTPVLTSDAQTAPMTPVPVPAPATTTTKTGS
jgi:hypothetical protein